jgi:hypothetical protein
MCSVVASSAVRGRHFSQDGSGTGPHRPPRDDGGDDPHATRQVALCAGHALAMADMSGPTAPDHSCQGTPPGPYEQK